MADQKTETELQRLFVEVCDYLDKKAEAHNFNAKTIRYSLIMVKGNPEDNTIELMTNTDLKILRAVIDSVADRTPTFETGRPNKNG